MALALRALRSCWLPLLLASLGSTPGCTKPSAAAPEAARQVAAGESAAPPAPASPAANFKAADKSEKKTAAVSTPVPEPTGAPAAVAYFGDNRAQAPAPDVVSAPKAGPAPSSAAMVGGSGAAPSDQRSAAPARKAPAAVRAKASADKAGKGRADHESDDLTDGTERYSAAPVNPLVDTAQERVSTFAMDVDTASYTIIRRKLLEGRLPPPEAVRTEEMLNYFHYPYPQPSTGLFAVQLDAVPSPFAPGRHLLRVGVQTRSLPPGQRRAAHLTFLIDVSGSMASKDKLPLTKQALRVLVDALQQGDTVGIVTFATTVKVALPSTPVEDKAKIMAVLDGLRTGGNTAMAEGLVTAYKQAIRDAGP